MGGGLGVRLASRHPPTSYRARRYRNRSLPDPVTAHPAYLQLCSVPTIHLMVQFPSLSSRAVAELCGVGVDMVLARRPKVSENDTSTVTGADGKQYPARRERPENRWYQTGTI